ncbi:MULTISPECIES: Holliday junction resolvase RecU [Oceanobacillus]|uniref:Holliday junction resolvase RecU n=1 Tax=Oceanobacillus kimchii TaxID=746691 RepID=A0ABQ5TIW9_9BACI|nr:MULTISPECIES: Holliday junction resolvase RecU [Oceanobacillus]MBT2598493.1 Holliday junction resolvase RecU [Oceanobacillus sp. ISL-74]MBT2651411.1 Holliday junction resolvase RecU [Oceanobacillus sp. ISL-73]GLO66410.1 Holliday junction resolvase RecU [Oceanobacillus kimchii]
MNYPNGQQRLAINNVVRKKDNRMFSNRGMSLEDDINVTNEFYLETNQAVIHKKPTPVQIVNVHYPKRSAAVITEAYFKQASTTDYNGVYKGKHIDFEAKETKNKTSFPLANIHEHQINHMQKVIDQQGICFMLIRFTAHDETYLLDARALLIFWNLKQSGGKKSIPYDMIKNQSQLIPFHYQKRVDYLTAVDKLYF